MSRTRRNPLSQMFAREAWRLLEPNLETVLREPDDLEARGAMQLGANFAGIGHRELHARRLPCLRQPADGPLRPDARHRHRHPAAARDPLQRAGGRRRCTATWPTKSGWSTATRAAAGEVLARRVTDLMRAADLPTRLSECGVSRGIFPVLAEEAAQQWTARFNPRPVAEADLLQLYEAAL